MSYKIFIISCGEVLKGVVIGLSTAILTLLIMGEPGEFDVSIGRLIIFTILLVIVTIVIVYMFNKKHAKSLKI